MALLHFSSVSFTSFIGLEFSNPVLFQIINHW